ncbi:MAG: recombinase family protein [Ruthenibacterium lactatiformans]
MTAAIYCRLSREDEEKQSESESIQNQKSMLIKYALDKGWDIYNIYCDEDYSGIDRERPAFRQLIADAEARRFDIVLVKTQSRFTRDMELVEKYIHGLFAEWGIRFVATVDNVDTDIKGNKKARQINGLVNEWYLEDLSENIRTVFDYKRRAGQYIGGFPLYGYRKDPADKNKLIVEPQAAAVVRRIYALYLAGHGTQSIAAILNRDGVPNPTRHKQAMGYPYRNGAAHNDHGLWNRTTVSRILRDQMYTGDLVQGRTKKISYKSKKMASVPQRDWIIVPDSHEPVISRRTFERARKCCMRTSPTGLGGASTGGGKPLYAVRKMQRYSNGWPPANFYLRQAVCDAQACVQIIHPPDWLRRRCRRLQCQAIAISISRRMYALWKILHRATGNAVQRNNCA